MPFREDVIIPFVREAVICEPTRSAMIFSTQEFAQRKRSSVGVGTRVDWRPVRNLWKSALSSLWEPTCSNLLRF